MSAQRLFVILALAGAVLFTFVTPPFQVPDEVGHFWRATSIAYGDVFPRIERTGGVSRVPQGFSTIVFVLWRNTAGARDVEITSSQFRTARIVPLEAEHIATVTFPAGYTPVPYLPQILAVFSTRPFPTPPIITFYLGRLFNAIVYVALIAIAIRVAPSLNWLFAAAGLLPMALFLAASWSPDALTIATAFLFTALLLRGARTSRDVIVLAICGAALGLCKPAYFLIVLLAFAVPFASRAGRAIVLAATLAGTALSMWNASRAFAQPIRPDVQLSPSAQIACVRHDPTRFAVAFRNEIERQGFDYVQQMVGRLGLLDVLLPRVIIWAEMALLLLCALSASPPGGVTVRAVALIISALTIAGIALSSYIGWTPPCASAIDGLQGRYLLPIVPLAFAIVSAPLVRRDVVSRIALLLVAIAANAVALFAVASRYYR